MIQKEIRAVLLVTIHRPLLLKNLNLVTAAEEREFTVYVKVPSNLREQVNFKVDLDAIQIEA